MLDTNRYPQDGMIETWVLSADQLKAQFDRVEPGTVIVYAVGDLAFERETARGDSKELVRKVGDYAYSLHRQGDAELTQKKLGPHRYEYWCIKR